MQLFQPIGVKGRIHYHELPGKGIPLLFVHGLGCSSSSDYPQVAAQAPLLGHHAFLVDLLGSGFSDKPPDFSYSITDHARTIAELIDYLNLDTVNLFGHSMGGAIAVETATLMPGRIAHLILSEPNLDPGGGMFSRGIGTQSEEEYVSTGHATLLRKAYAEGNDIWAGSLASALPAAIHREACSLIEGSAPSWREQLTALKMPRTVLFGEYSLPDPDTERLKTIGAKVRVIANAGHSMASENPLGVAEVMRGAICD